MKRQNDGIDVQGKAPSFPLYVSDLMAELNELSNAAGGAWMKLLCKMHFASRRGYLEFPNGSRYEIHDIARLIGEPLVVAKRLIGEMERKGTFSRDDRGCIFNRRMVRDTHISAVRRQAVSSRSDRSLKDVCSEVSNGFVVTNDATKEVQKRLSSSSSSSSKKYLQKTSTNAEHSEPDTPPPIEHDSEFEVRWAAWPAKGRRRKPQCEGLWADLFRALTDSEAGELHSAIDDGIDKWGKSLDFQKGFVFAFADFLAQKRWGEDPEPAENSPDSKLANSCRKPDGTPDYEAEMREYEARQAKSNGAT